MKADCLAKRGVFIGKVNSLLQEFGFVDSTVMVRLLHIYVTSFYGSNLWNLYSSEVTRIFSSWNVTIRHIFSVPRDTHRYFIESLSNSSHPKTMMCSRMVKFWDTLRTSRKCSVRYLANLVYDDRRTLVGRTVTNIANECEIERSSLNVRNVRDLRYFTPPPEEVWRVAFVQELLRIKNGQLDVPGISQEEIKLFIDEICST